MEKTVPHARLPPQGFRAAHAPAAPLPRPPRRGPAGASPEEKTMITYPQGPRTTGRDALRTHPAWRTYLAISVRLGRIAVQDGQRTLRDRLLDDAFRFEELLLRATGQTFCQITTAANADRVALTNAIRRTYRGGI
jgi:hypothetical protein